MTLGKVLPRSGWPDAATRVGTVLNWSFIVLALLAVLFAQSSRADVVLRIQAQPIADPIQTYVTVTDSSGNPVPGLKAEDFTVKLDGVALATAPTFSLPPAGTGATQNVSVVFAMDYSFSVTNVARAAMEQAVTDFINSMQAGDYAAIVKFNNTNPNKASVVRAFTQIDDGGPGDQALLQAVKSDYPGSGTNLFDAVVVSVGQFTAPPVPLPAGPRAIILVSDGGNNNSSADINAAVAAAVDANIAIFTVGVGDFSSATSTQILTNLAGETNGAFYPAPSNAQIADAYVQISELLNNSYVLSFVSTITDCLNHTLEVTVAGQAAPASASFTRCTNLLAPDVRGLTQAAATTALTGAGLVVGTVTQQSSSTVASGIVISQSPVVGTVVNPGARVNLVVSSGPPQVAVPNVVGQTQAAATTTLTGAGLVVGTVTQQSSSTVASGTVISQSPAAGSQAAAGSSVGLVVSSGPPPKKSSGGGGATGPLEVLVGMLLAGLLRRRRSA